MKKSESEVVAAVIVGGVVLLGGFAYYEFVWKPKQAAATATAQAPQLQAAQGMVRPLNFTGAPAATWPGGGGVHARWQSGQGPASGWGGMPAASTPWVERQRRGFQRGQGQ